MMIPQKIHQFWDTGMPPAAVVALMNSWRELNPQYQYQLWSDESVLRFIDTHFTQTIREVYLQCTIPAMRADLARYLILDRIGGVYADADLTCLVSLNDALDPNASIFAFKGWNGAWRTDFMGAMPGHPILAQIIAKTVHNVQQRISNNIWLVTGPGATTPIVQAFVDAGHDSIQTFEFNQVKGKILNFNHDLDYRTDGRHWADAQAKMSIYRNEREPG